MADLRRQKRIQFLKRKKPLRWQNVSRGGFFLVYETSFPYDKKRSARIALQRNGRMSLARPAAGGESCFAGFFIIVQETSFPYDNKCFTRMRTRRKNVPRHILFYRTYASTGKTSCTSSMYKTVPPTMESSRLCLHLWTTMTNTALMSSGSP